MPIGKTDVIGVISNRTHVRDREWNRLAGSENGQWVGRFPFARTFFFLARRAGAGVSQVPKRVIEDLAIVPFDLQAFSWGEFQ